MQQTLFSAYSDYHFVARIHLMANKTFLILSVLLGILPLLGVRRGWLSPTETGQSRLVAWSLSTGICFGGGVILTSCLTHMLPDVNEVGRVSKISS